MVLKYDGQKWEDNLKEELLSNYSDLVSAGFDNDKIIYQFKKLETYFSQPESEEIDGNSKKDRLARAESEKKASGDTIPSITTVINSNGFLNNGVKGYFKSKGYSLSYNKNEAAMLFKPGSSLNEYDAVSVLSDTMILVKKNGLYGLFTSKGLKVPVIYEGFSPAGTQSFIATKDGKSTYYSVSTNKFLEGDYKILGPVRYDPYTCLVQKSDLFYFIQPNTLKFIGVGFTPEKGKELSQYGSISTVRTSKGLAYIDLTNGNVLESIENIVFPFTEGVSRITRGGRTYNVNLNFKEVPDFAELGNKNFYLTIIVPKESAETVKWKPLFVNIYKANSGLAFTKYPEKRIRIDGYINSRSEVPDKYANVQFSPYPSASGGYITVMLPVGEYNLNISYSSGTQEKVLSPHKIELAKGEIHHTLTLNLHE